MGVRRDDPADRRGPIGSRRRIGGPARRGGLFLGPSAGQFYAGSYAKGAAATGFRLAAIPAGFLGGFMVTYLSGSSDDGDGFSGLQAMAAFATGALVAGGAVLAVGTVYSLVDTKFAVDRANERARKKSESRTSLSPVLYPARAGRVIPGLAFTTSF